MARTHTKYKGKTPSIPFLKFLSVPQQTENFKSNHIPFNLKVNQKYITILEKSM